MMTQHPINALIRPIANRHDVQENEHRQVIAFDIGAKRAIEAPKFGLLKRLAYYVVAPAETASHKLSNILVEDAIDKRKAPISIEYVVNSDRDRVYQLVKACHGNGDPGRFVDDVILKAVKAVEREHREQRQSLLDHRDEWRTKLTARIAADLNHIGLNVRMVEIRLVRRHSDDPITGSWLIKSSLRDLFDDEQAVIKINARLEVDDNQRLAFLLDENGPDRLKADIGTWAQRYFDLSVGISQLQPGERDDVERHLRTDLNRRVGERGWRIINLEVDITPPFELPVIQTVIDHPTDCPVQDRSNDVRVHHRLLVRLKDWKHWKKNCGKDPVPVLKEAVDRATNRVLFSMSYLDLIKAFNQPRRSDGQPAHANAAIRDIKERVSEVADNIGYEIEQLVSLPDAPVVILQRDGLNCSFEDEVPLQDNRIKGKVSVRLFAQLPDLSEIEAYLRDDDLERKITKDMHREIERVLVRTTPHRFHTKFSATGDDTDSVVEELQKAIAQKLDKEFKLQNMEISIAMGETELSKRFLKLAKGLHEAEANLVVGRGELGEAAIGEFGAETIPFTIRYSVEGIDGNDPNSWFRFQVRDYDHQRPQEEIDAINTVLADEFLRYMDQLPAAAIRSAEFQRDDVQRRIKQLLAKKIVEDFGIAITISSVTRREAASDRFLLDQGDVFRNSQTRQYQAAGEERADHAESATVSLQRLREQRLALILEDPDDPRLEPLKMQISELEEAIREEGSHAVAISAPRKTPALPSSDKVSISQHLDRLSGPSGEPKESPANDSPDIDA